MQWESGRDADVGKKLRDNGESGLTMLCRIRILHIVQAVAQNPGGAGRICQDFICAKDLGKLTECVDSVTEISFTSLRVLYCLYHWYYLPSCASTLLPAIDFSVHSDCRI